MQHIRQELSKFEEILELESFYNWLDTEEKLGKSFKQVVENLSKSADDDIYNRMDGIMMEITENVYIYSVDSVQFCLL